MNCKIVLAVLAVFLISIAWNEGMALAQTGNELRCQCINTHSEFINRNLFQDVKELPSGPHCQNVEVIGTLKNGREVCLEPTAPWVMRYVKYFLNKS